VELDVVAFVVEDHVAITEPVAKELDRGDDLRLGRGHPQSQAGAGVGLKDATDDLGVVDRRLALPVVDIREGAPKPGPKDRTSRVARRDRRRSSVKPMFCPLAGRSC